MLETRALCKTYGALTVSESLNLKVAEGELRAVIGPNGAGKTTLLAQLAGELPPSSGRIFLDGVDVTRDSVSRRCRRGIARTYQLTSLLKSFSTIDNVRVAVQGVDGHSFSFVRPMRAERALTDRALEALDCVGLLSRRDVAADELGYGEQRQLEIAMALATRPRLLLLDEPTAGMGAEDSLRIMELVRGLKGTMTIVLVEHDMKTVFGLADRISVLAQGREIVCGTVDEVRGNALVREHYLGEEPVDA
jgi:branched-chain amino acid transport system ATP-binding protein